MPKVKYAKRGGIIIKKFLQKISRIKCNILIPLGIGIIISAVLMNMAYSAKLNLNIEKEARKLGMVYPAEKKVLEGTQEEEKEW